MSREFHPGEKVGFKVTLYQASGAPTDSYDTITGITYTVSDPNAANITDEDAEPRDGELNFAAPSQPAGQDQFLDVSLDGDAGEGVVPIQMRSEPWVVVDGPAVSGKLELLELVQVNPPPPA
jgi:hypothetical protein